MDASSFPSSASSSTSSQVRVPDAAIASTLIDRYSCTGLVLHRRATHGREAIPCGYLQGIYYRCVDGKLDGFDGNKPFVSKLYLPHGLHT
jgi:hypothetical protein